jgi:hypothetical protein
MEATFMGGQDSHRVVETMIMIRVVFWNILPCKMIVDNIILSAVRT